jgi:hypothetical protein
VKEPLKLPFVFLFILLCVTFVLALLNVLATWGMYDSTLRAFTLRYAVQRFPRSLFDVTIPSVVLSIVLLGFRMARKPFSRFLGLLIVLVAGYVVIVNGMIWFRRLSVSVPPLQETSRQYIEPSTFTRMGGRIIAVRAIDAVSFRDLLVFDASRGQGRFALYPAGTVTARGGTVTLTAAGMAITGTPDPAAAALFTPDRFTAAFLGDMHTLTVDFERLMGGLPGVFFAACFSLVLLCTASLVLLRMTKWPLVNIMLLIIAVRGYFSLYHLFAVTLAPRVAGVIADPLAARLVPSAVFAAIAVILLLIDIIFIPADRWRGGARA